ncbi:hypothetical protein [Microcoleus sp. SVA1_A1]|uniref:hypothetical protein n=1 Tax=Microcoleus sp. SVA1_A1 TaxID=2818946 RepID=UPI002FCF13CD
MLGESANLAIGLTTLIHTVRSNQYRRFLRSGSYQFRLHRNDIEDTAVPFPYT